MEVILIQQGSLQDSVGKISLPTILSTDIICR